MVVQVKSMGLFGMDAFPITVETDLTRNGRGFNIVGLPDASVREARERVRAAVGSSGYEFPEAKIIVNLAPADIKKAGALYDLPIYISILSGAHFLSCDLSECAFIGELSLSGEVRPVNGILPMTLCAKSHGIRQFFVPAENAAEAAVVDGIDIIPVDTVAKLMSYLRYGTKLSVAEHTVPKPDDMLYSIDFSEVKGQPLAKRALEIAACGSHNLIFVGSPGTGKSMLAQRLPTILPDMTFDEMIETTKLHSVCGLLTSDTPLLTHRPFRSPHHTVSPAGLSGGGGIPKPGEISLAHNGVLFLDELPEFSREAMEILRQPLEDGNVTISRVNATLSYPCSIMLIAAMNPCPCGYYGHPTKPCTCSPKTVSRYLGKISGPLLDRIDLHVEVQPVDFDDLSSGVKAESSAEIKKRVNKVRNIQKDRFQDTNILCNAHIPPNKLDEYCVLDHDAKEILRSTFEKLSLSARAYSRILKVSRTIADMDDCELIKKRHVFEAIQYRSLDRKYWKN